MKEIEQRAKKFADEFAVGDAAIIVDIIHKVAEESYIKGATEQKEIDTDKACEYLRSHIFGHYPTREKIIEDFRKAMKGE